MRKTKNNNVTRPSSEDRCCEIVLFVLLLFDATVFYFTAFPQTMWLPHGPKEFMLEPLKVEVFLNTMQAVKMGAVCVLLCVILSVSSYEKRRWFAWLVVATLFYLFDAFDLHWHLYRWIGLRQSVSEPALFERSFWHPEDIIRFIILALLWQWRKSANSWYLDFVWVLFLFNICFDIAFSRNAVLSLYIEDNSLHKQLKLYGGYAEEMTELVLASFIIGFLSHHLLSYQKLNLERISHHIAAAIVLFLCVIDVNIFLAPVREFVIYQSWDHIERGVFSPGEWYAMAQSFSMMKIYLLTAICLWLAYIHKKKSGATKKKLRTYWALFAGMGLVYILGEGAGFHIEISKHFNAEMSDKSSFFSSRINDYIEWSAITLLLALVVYSRILKQYRNVAWMLVIALFLMYMKTYLDMFFNQPTRGEVWNDPVWHELSRISSLMDDSLELVAESLLIGFVGYAALIEIGNFNRQNRKNRL